MDYFKKIERSVTISADKRSTVDLQVDVWSQDLNVTKFILKLDTTDSAAIDLTNATVRVAMVYSQDGKDVKIEAAGIVEDVATQKIAYVMDDKIAGFEGLVIAGFYVTLNTGQRIDIQNVTFNMRKSLLDKDLEAATDNYYQTFDDIVADVQQTGDTAKTQIGQVLPDVQAEGEKVKTNINAVVSDVNGYADTQKQAINNIVSDVQSTGDTAKEDIKATLPTLQNQVNELSESITKNYSELKENLDSFTVSSKNLLDENSFTKDMGIYGSGATGQLSGTYLSPLINVDGLTDITVTLNGDTSVNAIRRCFYSNQTGSVVGSATSDLYPNKSTTFEVPSGAKYFRFSIPESYYNECINNGMMVESGKSYTGYTKYNTIVEVSVYSKGTIKYTNIYVGQNKQFKTIRSAIESIADSVGRSATSKSNYYNRYNIYIDSGTYDILSEFSFEELSKPDFEGIYIPDYVNIYGTGMVELTGDWDNYRNKFTDDESYYAFVISKHVVCPINTHKNCIFSNITIKTHNMRYCLHDEDAGVFYDSKQIFENCTFIAEEADSNVRAYIYATPVGIGISNRKITFKNCNFVGKTQAKQAFFFHSHASADKSSVIELENCIFSCGVNGHSILCTSYGEQTNNKVVLSNCSLKDIAHTKADNYDGNCDFTFVGGGNTDFMYSFSANDINKLLLDCIMCKNNSSSVISKGKPVRLHSYNTIMPFTTSTEKSSQFYGIAVEDIPANGYGLIKTHGFIKISDTSLQNANVGDLIGIVNKDLGIIENGYSFARCVLADWLLIN